MDPDSLNDNICIFRILVTEINQASESVWQTHSQVPEGAAVDVADAPNPEKPVKVDIVDTPVC